MKTKPYKNFNQYMPGVKDYSFDQVKQAFEHIIGVAKVVSLNYDFKSVVVANSITRFRLVGFTKTHTKGNG